MVLMYLLEANVHVKSERLSRVADGRDAELPIGRSDAGNQLHCVGPRVVPHLQTRRPVNRWEHSAASPFKGGKKWLTAKSETKLHCCMGWLYVGSVLTKARVKVSPGMSAHITMDDTLVPEDKYKNGQHFT